MQLVGNAAGDCRVLISRNIGIAYHALTGNDLKPDTSIQVLTATDVAIVVAIAPVFLVAQACSGLSPIKTRPWRASKRAYKTD